MYCFSTSCSVRPGGRPSAAGPRARRRRRKAKSSAVRTPLLQRDERALDRVLELAHVAGPVVVHQQRAAPRPRSRPPRARARAPGGRGTPGRAAGMSSRRSRSGGMRDVDHVQPVVEVVAEAALAHLGLRGRGASPRSRARRPGSRSLPPTRKKRRSCSTRSRSTCSLGEMSPISSRNSVPPSASSNLPFFCATAPGEGALLVAEQLGLEQRLGERRAGDRRRTGPWPRSPEKWIARATSSLPVPLSPWISTVERWLATLAHQVEHLGHARVLADQVVEAVLPRQLAAQDRVLALAGS